MAQRLLPLCTLHGHVQSSDSVRCLLLSIWSALHDHSMELVSSSAVHSCNCLYRVGVMAIKFTILTQLVGSVTISFHLFQLRTYLRKQCFSLTFWSVLLCQFLGCSQRHMWGIPDWFLFKWWQISFRKGSIENENLRQVSLYLLYFVLLLIRQPVLCPLFTTILKFPGLWPWSPSSSLSTPLIKTMVFNSS